MKAWRLFGADEPLQLVDVPVPTAGRKELVIDVKAAGICHSDIGYLDGTLTPILGFVPITLGHEIAGLVSDIGTDVTGFQIGQRVAIPATYLGPGTSMDGGFAEKVRAFDYQVVAIPDGVPWDQAAVATDAGVTSYHSLKIAGVKAGTKLGIIGAGGLGSMAIQFAKAIGAQIFVAHVNHEGDDRKTQAGWDRATALGADKVAKNIREFADEKLEVIVDYAGFDTTTNDAIETVGFRGTVVQVGMGSERANISTTTMILKQLTYLGSNAGTNESCSEVLDMIAAGAVSSSTERIGFDEIYNGIQRFQRGEARARLVAVRP